MPGKFGVLEIQWVCLYFEFLFKVQLILISHHFLLIKYLFFILPPLLVVLNCKIHTL